MTPEEVAFFQYTGLVVGYNMAILLCDTFFYGVYCVVVGLMFVTLLKRTRKTRATIVISLISIVMFLLTTAYWASTSVGIFSTKIALLDGSEQEVSDRLQGHASNQVTLVLLHANLWFNGANFIFADSVVLWRAWVISGRNKFVLVPFLLLFGSAATFIAAATIVALINAPNGGGSDILAVRAGSLQNAAYILSLATNVLATCLVAHRYIEHRHFMNVHGAKKQTSGEHTLLNLIESGVIYCLFQIVLVALCMSEIPNRTPADLARRIFMGSTTIVSAIYPTAIIVIVNLRRSMADKMANETGGVTDQPGGQLVVATHLAFAQDPITTTGFDTNNHRLSGLGHGFLESSTLPNNSEKSGEEKGIELTAL